jgi:hypothetical protein
LAESPQKQQTPFFELIGEAPDNRFQIAFPAIESGAIWASNQLNYWQRLQQEAGELARTHGITNLSPCQAEISRYTALNSHFNRALESPTPDYVAACKNALGDLRRAAQDKKLLIEGTPLADRIISLQKTDPVGFLFALGLGSEQGPTLIVKNENGGSNLSLSTLFTAYMTRFPPLLEHIDGYSQYLRTERDLWSGERRKATEEMASLHSGFDGVKGLEATYRTKLQVETPVTYWRSKARWHTVGATLSFAFFVVAVVGFLYAFEQWGREIIPQAISAMNVNGGTALPYFALITVPALAGFWVLRLISRLYIVNLQRRSDAAERATMVETYVALSADEKRKPTPEERLLILQALFRPGPGDAADSSPQENILDSIAKLQSGKT